LQVGNLFLKCIVIISFFEEVHTGCICFLIVEGAVFIDLFYLTIFLVQKGTLFLRELPQILRDDLVMTLDLTMVKQDPISADGIHRMHYNDVVP
jgi:hypothetical protein